MELNGSLFDFQSSDRLVLYGFRVQTGKKNRRVVIFVHGMNGSFYGSTLVSSLAAGIKGLGTDFMTIGTRGSHYVNGIRKANGTKIVKGGAYEKFVDCVKDIEGAVKKAGEYGYREIILAGHSTGCQKITYYQAVKKDKRVKALLLLAPADDYNIELATKGRTKLKRAVRLAQDMKKVGCGDYFLPRQISLSSAARYLSIADLKNVEANVFNYTSDLKYFSQVKTPIFAAFGTREIKCGRSSRQMLDILEAKTNARLFEKKLVVGANHGFRGKETSLLQGIRSFLRKLQ